MAGKGKRRREKNYKAAHGVGSSRLPPPPNASSVDKLPSKLRKLISLTGTEKALPEIANDKSKGKNDRVIDKMNHSKDFDSKLTVPKGEGDDTNLMERKMDHGSAAPLNDTCDKKKKKRKRKTANDLRFDGAEVVGGSGSKRKERKIQRLEERKKKHKKIKAEEDFNFPGHEEIKFGDVVEAPPKLVTLPKRFNNTQDASHQRLRLQAVEDYRKRKAWASRPGIHLPTPVTEPQML